MESATENWEAGDSRPKECLACLGTLMLSPKTPLRASTGTAEDGG